MLAIRKKPAIRPADEMTMRSKTKRANRPPKKAKRPIGLAKGKVKMTKSFSKPLPAELLDAFEGKS